MKRGLVEEAEMHGIRRKIEEKQVMIREQRKVRERLSRDCADTLRQIASVKAAIKNVKDLHEETLREKQEDFEISTEAKENKVHEREEERGELERLVTSSDIVERQQKLLSQRLTDLRVDDEKEKGANARELDILKRNTFNTRNELGNAFRTMLHDVKMAYQSQAFDSMVREATTARDELPLLQRKLWRKTRRVNRVIATQAGSSRRAGKAKIFRDVDTVAVNMQARRASRLERQAKELRERAAQARTELEDAGRKLETFREEAEELRATTAELRSLQAESARKENECSKLRMWAYTLSRQVMLAAAMKSIGGRVPRPSRLKRNAGD